jgi:hypothetical protein
MQTFTRNTTLKMLINGKWREVPAHIELDIDIDKLATYLGGKAYRNRNLKTALLHGMIKASVAERETVTTAIVTGELDDLLSK